MFIGGYTDEVELVSLSIDSQCNLEDSWRRLEQDSKRHQLKSRFWTQILLPRRY